MKTPFIPFKCPTPPLFSANFCKKSPCEPTFIRTPSGTVPCAAQPSRIFSAGPITYSACAPVRKSILEDAFQRGTNAPSTYLYPAKGTSAQYHHRKLTSFFHQIAASKVDGNVPLYVVCGNEVKDIDNGCLHRGLLVLSAKEMDYLIAHGEVKGWKGGQLSDPVELKVIANQRYRHVRQQSDTYVRDLLFTLIRAGWIEESDYNRFLRATCHVKMDDLHHISAELFKLAASDVRDDCLTLFNDGNYGRTCGGIEVISRFEFLEREQRVSNERYDYGIEAYANIVHLRRQRDSSGEVFYQVDSQPRGAQGNLLERLAWRAGWIRSARFGGQKRATGKLITVDFAAKRRMNS